MNISFETSTPWFQNCLKYCLQDAIYSKCDCESVALPTLSNARNICDIFEYNGAFVAHTDIEKHNVL